MLNSPLGLLGLLAVPAVIGLHLYRRRFRPRPAAGLFLWSDGDRTELSGRKRERLIRSPSLWLECAAALLLGLALAGPRGCSGSAVQGWSIVIDDSASMRAGGGERAKAQLTRLLRKLPGKTRVLLVAAGTRPRALTSVDSFPGEALEALGQLEFAASAADLPGALDLVERLALTDRPVTVLTDVAPDPEQLPHAEVHSYGQPAANLSLHGPSRRTADQGLEVVTALLANNARTNNSPTVLLEGFEAGTRTELQRQTLDLAPDETRLIKFVLPASQLPLALRLDNPDTGSNALDLDDQVWIAPNRREVLQVHVQLPPGVKRRLGLDGEAWLNALAPARLCDDPADADLGVVLAGAANVGFDSRAVVLAWDIPADESSSSWLGPFLLDRTSPVLEGVAFSESLWTGPAEDSPGPSDRTDRPLVSAGARPLLIERGSSSFRHFVMRADPERCSWVRSPDWPVLLANLGSLARAEQPGPARTNLAVGAAVSWRFDERGDALLSASGPLASPLAERNIQSDATGDEARLELPAPGLWEVRDPTGRAQMVGVTLANQAESDLGSLSTAGAPLDGPPQKANGAGDSRSGPAQSGVTRLRTWLAIAAGLLCLVDLFFTRGARRDGSP